MGVKRQKQTGEVIKRHFSQILLTKGRGIYGDAFVTCTHVMISPDLSYAKIYLSVFNTDSKQAIIDICNQNVHELRRDLAHRIKRHVRRIPDIAFFEDDTLDEMYRVERLLKNNAVEEE